MRKNKKGYKYYACYKDGHNGGMYFDGKDSCIEAYNEMEEYLKRYVTNDLIFIGVVKCKDGNPIKHIVDIN